MVFEYFHNFSEKAIFQEQFHIAANIFEEVYP